VKLPFSKTREALHEGRATYKLELYSIHKSQAGATATHNQWGGGGGGGGGGEKKKKISATNKNFNKIK
jgi:hypothetical protein